jgi:hypothetical protein
MPGSSQATLARSASAGSTGDTFWGRVRVRQGRLGELRGRKLLEDKQVDLQEKRGINRLSCRA